MEARSLTRKELRALREAGLDIGLEEEQTEQKVMDMVDWIADHVLAIPEDTPFSETMKLCMDSYRLTYGREEEGKN